MLLMYNLLTSILLLFYLPWLLLKKGPEKKLTFLKERLGVSRYERADIWVHAVSVGETIATLPLMRKLKKEFPDKKIVFSTTTYTGQKIASEKFPEANRVMYMPLDTVLCAGRVINCLKPDIFITIETEIWPFLYHRLKNIGSRIILLNGRLSEKSYKGYRLVRFLMKKVLSNVDFFYMQSNDDASRIIKLGADKTRVGVMGNLKFDMDFPKGAPLPWLDNINGKVLLAGSTHRGEDEIILDAYKKIKEAGSQGSGVRGQGPGTRDQISDLKLILAPRHPERFDEVEKIIKERGLNYIRRTRIQGSLQTTGGQAGVPPNNRRPSKQPAGKQGSVTTDSGQKTSDHFLPDVILLDTIGELPQIFSIAYVTFVGGSLLPYGGHNILEPAYWGKPVIFGPHMENFPIAKEFIEKSAACLVRNSNDIAEKVIELMENTDKAKEMGQNAKEIVDINSGAANKAIELIRSFLGTV